jgi:hypothetical protein
VSEKKYNIRIEHKKGFEIYNNVEECIVNPIREMIKNKHEIKEVKIYYKKEGKNEQG